MEAKIVVVTMCYENRKKQYVQHTKAIMISVKRYKKQATNMRTKNFKRCRLRNSNTKPGKFENFDLGLECYIV